MRLKRLTVRRKRDSEECNALNVTIFISCKIDQQYADQDHHKTTCLHQAHVFACKEYAQQYRYYRVYVRIGAHLRSRPDL